MPLEVQCPSCSTRYRVGDDKGGKQLRCRKCQAVIDVPLGGGPLDPFAVFENTGGTDLDPLRGIRGTTYGGDGGATVESDNDLFGNFNEGPSFANAPTLPPASATPAGRSHAGGGDNSLLIGVGLGAVVVIALAIGTFVYLQGERKHGNGGGDAGGVNELARGGDQGPHDDTVEGVIDGDHVEVVGSGPTTSGSTLASGGSEVMAEGDKPGDGSDPAAGSAASDISTGGSAPAADATMVYSGTLAVGDPTLQIGEYYDEYSFEGQTGQRVSITQQSQEFDTFLVLETPSGLAYVSNNAGGSQSSALRMPLPETGTYRVVATSLEAAETGSYELTIEQSPERLAHIENGALQSGDPTGADGAYQDTYAFQGVRGQRIVILTTSTEFDTLVRLTAPDGGIMENDDACYRQFDDIYVEGGVGTDSLLIANLPVDGEYQINVTSYYASTTGAYTLAYDLSEPAERVEQESLGVRDGRLPGTNSYYDSYTVRGESGQRIWVTLSSFDFDPKLILTAPSGATFEADDAYTGVLQSQLVLTLSESGEYQVLVTTYETGSKGKYVLAIDFE